MVLSARRGLLALCALASTFTFGCASVPTFASVHDAGSTCSTSSPCPSGQNCLQGTCYAACDATHACSVRETCTSGVCMPRTTDGGVIPRDMGMDGGFCDMTTCATPTPVCRGDVSMCTQCGDTNRDECGGATSVCDVGRGGCVAFSPTLCGPCNVTADCPSGLSCVHRMAPNADERVCLPGCLTAACSDPGFTCLDALCTPFVGSCTAYRAAVTAHGCATDADCPQMGATLDNGLVTGMCFDGGGGSMTCHAACGDDTHCPPGLSCAASPVGGTIHFCQ